MPLLLGAFGASPWDLWTVASPDTDAHYHLCQSIGEAIEDFVYQSGPLPLREPLFLRRVERRYIVVRSLEDQEDDDCKCDTEGGDGQAYVYRKVEPEEVFRNGQPEPRKSSTLARLSFHV